jgi:hypothetical protein
MVMRSPRDGDAVARDGDAVARDEKFGQIGATARVAPTSGKIKTSPAENAPIGNIVGAYKSLVMNSCLKIFKQRNEYMGKLWQRNYYEHIIRNPKALYFIRSYIRENPTKWVADIDNHIVWETKQFEMVQKNEH